MSSVTGRIKEIKQPRGGYINPKTLTRTEFHDGVALDANENISAITVGSAVDYLTRFLIGVPVRNAFADSIMGLALKAAFTGVPSTEVVDLDRIRGMDRDSIAAACRLASADVWLRDKHYALTNQIAPAPVPDKATTENIRVMLQYKNPKMLDYIRIRWTSDA